MRRSWPIAWLAPLAALVLPTDQSGQAARPPAAVQQPFRARTDVVTVDALVTDKQGRPVPSLSASDFEVKERGRLQTVDTFKFIDVDQAAQSLPVILDIHSDEDIRSQAAREDVRLFVVFLDDYHVQRLNSEKVRTQIAQAISRINPRDLVAIMYPATPVESLVFSHDRAALATAIDQFNGRKYEYLPPSDRRCECVNQEALRAESVFNALEKLSVYLGTLSERRKTILYVGEGPTGTLPPWVCSAPCNSAFPPPFPVGSPRPGSLQPSYIQTAIEHNVAVYTLDPRGTAFDDFEMRNNINSAASGRRNVASAQEALRNLAYQTGGRAMVGVNEFGDMLQQMVRDSSAYYLLGYTSNLAKHDGQFHEIAVRVKRPGVDVRARPGYWAWDESSISRAPAPKSTVPDDVKAALDTLAAETRSTALRTWTAVTRGTAGKTDVTLVWEPGPQSRDRAIDHVAVKATAASGEVYADTTATSDSGSSTPGGQMTFAAGPGPLTLRVVAFSANGEEVDSERRDLTVPDYTGTSVAFSTPLVFEARSARELQQIRVAVTPRPAASREFLRTDRLLVRFRTFGPGGTAPAATMRLLNQAGTPLVDLPPPTVRAGGGFEAEVALASLLAGGYLIELGVSTEAGTSTALIPFRIGQ